MLLTPLSLEGGGFHFFGDSSIGKSAIAYAAASVYGRGGSPGFVRQWRSTANGLESAAAIHNDALLVLDEIGTVDPKEAAAAAYQLVAGVSKNRSTKDNSLGPALTWRTNVLSTGEIRLADKLRESNQRAMAGHSVRLADVPADAGRGFGVFDHTGECGSAKELAERIKQSANCFFGTAGPSFAECLTTRGLDEVRRSVGAAIAKFLADCVPDGADGQVHRVAARFALAAAAGELAREFGIVPWAESSAYGAAAECFRAWLRERGGLQPAEVREAISRVRRFIEAHGLSRFQPIEQTLSDQHLSAPYPIANRAGYRRGSSADAEWLILPETWASEICAGLDQTRTARILADHGMLVPGGDGFSCVQRIEGRPTRVYKLTSKILAGESDE
jgi:uncharacterized protein (DUF927 family)